MDSSSVAFGALSYLLQSKGVRMGNYGMVIRHDNGKQSGFNFWEAGHGKNSGDLAGRLGECSYKVFLDVGGTPKTRAQKYADNNFPTTFIVFPLASNSQLGLLANATNADDLPMLLAFYEQAAKGKSGKPLLDDWVAKGRTGARPKSYNRVLDALQGAGFSAATTPASTRPDWGDFPARGQAARMG
jgi:hypothetical protein